MKCPKHGEVKEKVMKIHYIDPTKGVCKPPIIKKTCPVCHNELRSKNKINKSRLMEFAEKIFAPKTQTINNNLTENDMKKAKFKKQNIDKKSKQRKSSKAYYENNKEIILKKARVRRAVKKLNSEKFNNKLKNDQLFAICELLMKKN